MGNRIGSLDDALRALAGRQHGLVARGQALAAGVTGRMVQRRIESGMWVVAHPGVYRMAGAPVTWEQRVMAATLATGAVASYRTAARLWGLDGDWRDLVEITASSKRRLAGVAVHRSNTRVDRGRREGIACTTATRTLIDLATVLAPDRLEEALDSALREQLTSPRISKRGSPRESVATPSCGS